MGGEMNSIASGFRGEGSLHESTTAQKAFSQLHAPTPQPRRFSFGKDAYGTPTPSGSNQTHTNAQQSVRSRDPQDQFFESMIQQGELLFMAEHLQRLVENEGQHLRRVLQATDFPRDRLSDLPRARRDSRNTEQHSGPPRQSSRHQSVAHKASSSAASAALPPYQYHEPQTPSLPPGQPMVSLYSRVHSSASPHGGSVTKDRDLTPHPPTHAPTSSFARPASVPPRAIAHQFLTPGPTVAPQMSATVGTDRHNYDPQSSILAEQYSRMVEQNRSLKAQLDSVSTELEGMKTLNRQLTDLNTLKAEVSQRAVAATPTAAHNYHPTALTRLSTPYGIPTSMGLRAPNTATRTLGFGSAMGNTPPPMVAESPMLQVGDMSTPVGARIHHTPRKRVDELRAEERMFVEAATRSIDS